MQSGTFNVKDAVNITNNKQDTGDNEAVSNVYLFTGKKMTVAGQLKDASDNIARIGVSMTAVGTFTSKYTSKGNTCIPSVYFTSDNASVPCLYLSENEATIGTHAASDAYSSDETGHWHACVNGCGSKLDEAAHDFDKKTATAEYLKAAATCTKKATYYYSCECGRKGAETFEHGELGHVYGAWISKKAATCTAEGTLAHKDCSVCHKHFDDNNNEIDDLTVDIDPTAHSLTHVAKVKPTLQANGNIEHWICADCGKKFSDSIGINIINDVILRAQLVKTDGNGEDIVVVTTSEGFTQDVELEVTEIARDDYSKYQSVVNSVNGEVSLAYDITLKSGGVAIHPVGTLEIELHIPESLKDKSFKIFLLHENNVTETAYSVNADYAVVTVDGLSEFIFVGEKTMPTADTAPNAGKGLSNGAIAGITVGVIFAVLLAVYIVGYFALYRKRKLLNSKFFDVIYKPLNAVFKNATMTANTSERPKNDETPNSDLDI